MSTYRYNATVNKEGGVYTVEFTDFGIRGRGFPDYDDTLAFAADMLSEILLDYRAKERELPKPTAEPASSEVERTDDAQATTKPASAEVERTDDAQATTKPASSEVERTDAPHTVLITADPDAYGKRIEANAGRVFHEFEPVQESLAQEGSHRRETAREKGTITPYAVGGGIGAALAGAAAVIAAIVF